LPDLIAASETLVGISPESPARLPLVRDLHLQALAMLLDDRVVADETIQLLGAVLDENGQRIALEHTFRSLAKLARTEAERWSLVDAANSHRPRTLT
jgi:serine/threonine-protein kinase PknG